MKLHINELIKANWFFVALVGFVLVLPLSPAMVSVFSGVAFLVALLEDSWNNKLNRLREKKVLLLVPVVFIIYLLSSLLTIKGVRPFYDVQKTMFYFVFPIAFVLGKDLNAKQKRFVFYTFVFSVFLATLVTVLKWKFSPDNVNFSVHNASPVSHIRFSFQLILVFWFLFYLLKYNHLKFTPKQNLAVILLSAYFLLFLLFQQSLTGIIALGASFTFFLISQLLANSGRYKWPLVGIVVLILAALPLYLVYVIHQFYSFEEVDRENIALKTANGNLYRHDFDNRAAENGNFVYLYVCEEEMRQAWNKRSRVKYDDMGGNGYPVYASLMRYLTSKGLRKDAEGVNSLTQKDVLNIENGMANHIFQKKFSLYPRIYQTIWEYHIYSTTGDPNNQSFSQRIEFAKAAITIIKENVWLGVGTGNWRKAYEDAYQKNNSQLDREHYSSAHNQYLNYWVKFGVIGLLLILGLLVFPIVKTKRYRDLLFLTFLIFMLFANLADSNWESHMGSSFFVFFYCVFITGARNYLQLELPRRNA